jgi:NADH:ubiquinone oxidoreductase subunit 3 (subunit A)
VPSGWPNGWNVYYIVFLAGALSLVVPALLAVLSYFFSPSRTQASPKPQPTSHEANPTDLGKRTNPRAFIALNAALALFAFALLLLPCVVTLNSNPSLSLICVLSLCSLASLALLYGIRKRDMEWLVSFNKKGPDA